jgi:hypothetical protein
MSTTSTTTAPLTLDERTLWRKIESRSFCNLATTSMPSLTARSM